MSETLNSLSGHFTPDQLYSYLRAGIMLVAGIIIAKILSSFLAKVFTKKANAQHAILVRRISFYLFSTLIIFSVLEEVGFKLSVFMGAAGIVTVALGFASQTSVSNIISGLFLRADRPFRIGDIIKVGETTGVVNSIELLSVKVRTFQNGLVRIPNETMIKTDVLNYTYFPIRRIDIDVGVAYKEDIARVREILFDVASKNPLCLEEPPPIFIFKGYGDSSIDMMFGVWTVKENFLLLMNSIKQEIKEAFDKNGIEIPFPHRTLYTGSVTDPFPVMIMNEPGNNN
ncbi:MAG: mechanosensitive ion channel family protein [Candidatus Latescibacteria bacterium]|nr:mechanosensitive ion channel family protein [Candidatus Latescibacterota bacterium]